MHLFHKHLSRAHYVPGQLPRSPAPDSDDEKECAGNTPSSGFTLDVCLPCPSHIQGSMSFLSYDSNGGFHNGQGLTARKWRSGLSCPEHLPLVPPSPPGQECSEPLSLHQSGALRGGESNHHLAEKPWERCPGSLLPHALPLGAPPDHSTHPVFPEETPLGSRPPVTCLLKIISTGSAFMHLGSKVEFV